METAIKKAIEGGWGGAYYANSLLRYEISPLTRVYGIPCILIIFSWTLLDGDKKPYNRSREVSMYEILLDPLFWQALGKAEGWKRWFVMESYQNTSHVRK